MTPTTASSSIILLNPVAQKSDNTAAAIDAKAAPDAALSGFQLLLGAMQQVQQKLSVTPGEGDAEATAADKANGDSGNALPQPGTILPLAGLSPAALDETAQAGAAASAKSKDKKDNDTDTVATDVMPTVVAMLPAFSGFVIQPPRPSGTAAITVASDDAVVAARFGADAALTAQTAADTALKAQAGTDAALKAQSGADAALTAQFADFKDFGAIKDAETDRAGNKTVAPMTTVSSLNNPAAVNANPTAIAAEVLKSLQGGSKPAAESDFDTLVKHFDTSAPTQLSTTSNVSDNAGVHQASRTYFDTASNTASVSVPVGSDGWSDAVTDKVMWFSANKISSAEIHLNPPDLGPLQVRVSTQHDQMSVIFTSQHAAVRDALDQALPRLRDMMGSQGMHLLDVSVGGQGAQQQQQQFGRNGSADRSAAFGGLFSDDGVESAAVSVTTVNTARLLRSGVDAYA